MGCVGSLELLSPSTESHGPYVAGSRARQATHLHAAQPAHDPGEYAATPEPPVWSAGDTVMSVLERVDPGTRSAHRQMREHRAGQIEAPLDRYDGVTPPAPTPPNGNG